MVSPALLSKFQSKRKPAFGDEGEPDAMDAPRGGGAGDGTSDTSDTPDMATGGVGADPEAGGYGDKEKALDALADILGVGPEDRQDFSDALEGYVEAVIAEPENADASAAPPIPAEGPVQGP
jgi:hypothetical protein